jgi:hypothetical protein
MAAHTEIPVKVNAWVDEGIAPLVEALNEFEHVSTAASCEDDQSAFRRGAYVMFSYEGGDVAGFASGLAATIDEQAVLQIEWRLGEDQPPLLTLSCPPDHVRNLACALSPRTSL